MKSRLVISPIASNSKKSSILIVLFSLAFLCAVINHSYHSSSLNDTVELQHCKICQQSLDKPTNINISVLAIINDYYHKVAAVNHHISSTPRFIAPQLRAPPTT
jgi:hypothetical protein